MRTTFKTLAVATAAALLPITGLAALTAESAGAAAGAATAASSRYCGLIWSSSAKSVGTVTSLKSITGVRAGRQACFDRFVIDGATFARVGYVTTVYAEGSGLPIPLRGGAKLNIVTNRAESVATGVPTFRPANPKELANFAGFRSMRQAAFGGSFEGQSTIGLGVRARLPFRVFVVKVAGQPSKVVIDVAHRW